MKLISLLTLFKVFKQADLQELIIYKYADFRETSDVDGCNVACHYDLDKELGDLDDALNIKVRTYWFDAEKKSLKVCLYIPLTDFEFVIDKA